MKRKIYLMAGLMMAFIACQKEKATNLPIDRVPVSKVDSIIPLHGPADPANASNPYDRAGAIHNMGLKAVMDYVANTGDTTRSGKDAFLKDYFKAHFSVSLSSNHSHKLEAAIFKDYKAVLYSGKISERGKELLGFMVGILEGLKRIDNYPSYKKQFVALEQIIASEHLLDKEKEMLLSTASVFRHSGYYWMDFYQNNETVETWGILRKIAGFITGVAADATSWFYYGFTSASFYERVEDTISMSECCGYYTGWY